MRPKRFFLSFAAACTVMLAQAGVAGTSERVVADRFSGLAISGYDPVAYFTDAAPREGRDEIELEQGGAIWRFRNVGNRDSFLARPDIYAPQFGGHDPIDVARGVARPGRPHIWVIVDRALYLFADESNRQAFARTEEKARHAAYEAWPKVVARLAR